MSFGRRSFQEALYEFLGGVTILSKDEGERPLLPLMGSQKYALDQLLDGLQDGVRWFVIDKCRQAGLTTLWLAVALFWAGIYKGVQGAIVTDTEANKEETVRARIDEMIDHLPAEYPLPLRKGRSGHNKNGIHFDQGSVIQYLVAGTRKGAGSLGRSRSLNFLLATEVSSYGDPDQLETLKAALSDNNPNRLYIFESTPNSYNLFYDLWNDAVADTLTQKAIFIAWWQHSGYSYDEDNPLFDRYGHPVLTPEESEISEEVFERFGHRITRGQWAWYRHHRNPQGGTELAAERAERFCREYPSTPEEGFRASGSPFVNPRVLGRIEQVAQKRMVLPYYYELSDDHRSFRRIAGRRGLRIDLKVWQEPVAGAAYVVSGDPAFASGEEADAYCAQVNRCYADRFEQVAEFHRRGIEPYQFAWVLAELCGWYVNVRMILEINGPGAAVDGEFRHIRSLAAAGELDNIGGGEDLDERRNFLGRVKTYLYHRPDSLAGGYAIHWKTSGENRTPLLVALANEMWLGECEVNSVALIDEMRRLRQTGSVIEPEGTAHDDRVMAEALGLRAWLDWERAGLRAAGRTWEAEHAEPDKPAGDPVAQFLTYNVNQDRERRAQQARMMHRREAAKARDGRWGW